MNPQRAFLLERLVGLKFSSESRAYIHVIASDAEGIVCLSYRPRKYLTTDIMFCISKNQNRPGMGYCFYIWIAAAQLTPSSLDRLRKRSCSRGGDEIFSTRQPVSNRRDVISFSLVFIYYYSRCSNEFHCVVLIFQTIAADSCYSIIKVEIHSFRVPLI